MYILESGKRGFDRLDAECLVSLAKRKEDFYSSGESQRTHLKNKCKDYQELGESISIEADSGFETLSSSVADSTACDIDHKNVHEKPLRRSPRNAYAIGRNIDKIFDSENKYYLTHSTSLDAIPNSPNQQVITRSKSLRLSVESNSSKLLTSPNFKRRTPESSNKFETCSTSNILKFDSSLLSDSNTNVNEENACKNSIETNCSEKGTSNNSNNGKGDKELATDKYRTNVKYSYQIHRDIHNLKHIRKHHCENESRIKSTKRHNNRIVYCPGLFQGRERMDILRRLNDMNATHILNNILSVISAEDLGRSLQVGRCSYLRKLELDN